MGFNINPFSLHYFLWFAGLTSIYGYISVYAEYYANASSSQYGLLNMVLPFVTIVAKIFFCSLADRHRAYRTFFVCFLAAALFGYGSFGILPFFIVPQPKTQGLNLATWILICIMTSVATVSMGVISCLSDAFAMNSSKKNNSSYGFIRVWGTLGWGSSAILISFINQSDKLPFLVPGILTTIILISIDIITAIYWPNSDDFNLDKSASDMDVEDVVSVLAKETRVRPLKVKVPDESDNEKRPTNNYGTYDTNTADVQTQSAREQTQITNSSDVMIQWLLFREVAKRRRSLFRYMILFTISGALIALQWSYFFLYLDKIYHADFAFISGLSMVVQSILGELPFFILSECIISKLGRSHTLSLSIVSIGVRYFLYQYLLPISIMTEVGLDYSDCEEAIIKIVEEGLVDNNQKQIEKLRQALRATMQSLMSACYEGLGVGIGSIIGGLIIDNHGFESLWIWAGITATTLGLANLLIEISGLPFFVDRRPSLVINNN